MTILHGGRRTVGSVLLLGRRIVPDQDGRAEFNVVIPAKYTIIGENGLVSATLDGIKMNGSRDLYSWFARFDPALPKWEGVCDLVARLREGIFSVRKSPLGMTFDACFFTA